MSTCKCDTADTSRSGAYPLNISDFTDDFTLHFSYSNWDEYAIFTCNACHTIWLLEGMYWDRPPYVSHASKITQKEVDNLKEWSTEEINNLIESKGISQVITNILKGTARSLYYGNIAPEDID